MKASDYTAMFRSIRVLHIHGILTDSEATKAVLRLKKEAKRRGYHAGHTRDGNVRFRKAK